MPKPTRKQMINDIVKQVEDWELETLIDYARKSVRDQLDKQPDEIIKEEYESFIDLG